MIITVLDTTYAFNLNLLLLQCGDIEENPGPRPKGSLNKPKTCPSSSYSRNIFNNFMNLIRKDQPQLEERTNN